MKLDMERLEEARQWVLNRENPREGALFLFAWVMGVCSAAGIRFEELVSYIESLGGRPERPPQATRDLCEVLDRMLPLVPLDEPKLRGYLEWARGDAPFKPPEGQPACWRAVGDVLQERFGEKPPTEGWGKQVVDIFMGVA